MLQIRMNIEGDPDGATMMPLTFQWRSLSFVFNFNMIKSGAVHDELATNVYVEV